MSSIETVVADAIETTTFKVIIVQVGRKTKVCEFPITTALLSVGEQKMWAE